MAIISRTSHSGHVLAREIVARSSADSWHRAKREWELSNVFFSPPDEPGTCLCGHFPIREQCVLVNRENGNVAIVGNVCVKRFLGLDSEALFAPFRRIMKNREAALGIEAIRLAHAKGWIDDRERLFCLNTRRARNYLSRKQLAWRVAINTRIIGRLTEREARDA